MQIVQQLELSVYSLLQLHLTNLFLVSLFCLKGLLSPQNDNVFINYSPQVTLSL